MKLVGFIKEYNGIEGTKNYADFLSSEELNEDLSNKILEYLYNGISILEWMGGIHDHISGSVISFNSYYTDGEWVWPEYFCYYLRNCSTTYLDTEFLTYLKEKDFYFNMELAEKNRRDFEKRLIEIQK